MIVTMQPAVHRQHNKGYYRVLHVPIWIWVFFTLPGGLTAELYYHGFNRRHAIWLALVAAVCIWRGARGRLPGAEPRPYITHYGLTWPNLGYRVACYTAAWIAIVVPWTLNVLGLAYATAGGPWILERLYGWPYDLCALAVVVVAAADRLPRTHRTIYGEGAERAWFYVGVWTAILSQLAGWAVWRLTPHASAAQRLGTFLAVSAIVFALGFAGRLPRTRRYYVQPGGDLQAAAGE
jgi:hypothetical protein